MTQAKPDTPDQLTRKRVVLLATNNSNSIIGEIVDGKTNTIAYSTYGEQSAQQDIKTRLGFNGQLREGSIGWYLLGNGYRAYNPRLMRFHSPDSWSPFGGGGLNAYMYCVGDPVNRADPTGHFTWRSNSTKTGIDISKSGSSRFVADQGRKGSIINSATSNKASSAGKNSSLSRGLTSTNAEVIVGSGNPKLHALSNTFKQPGTSGSTVSYNAPQAVYTGQSSEIPIYTRATSPLQLWSLDTFARSQPTRTYTVNRMVVNRPDVNLQDISPFRIATVTPTGTAALPTGGFGAIPTFQQPTTTNPPEVRANLQDAQQILRNGR